MSLSAKKESCWLSLPVAAAPSSLRTGSVSQEGGDAAAFWCAGAVVVQGKVSLSFPVLFFCVLLRGREKTE